MLQTYIPIHMDNLDKLSISQLADILSTQTTLYVQMHAEGAKEIAFQKCRLLIEAVQEEIKSRSERK